MRALRTIWWLCVLGTLVVFLGTGVAVGVSGRSKDPLVLAVFLVAISGSVWSVGSRVHDILTVESLNA